MAHSQLRLRHRARSPDHAGNWKATALARRLLTSIMPRRGISPPMAPATEVAGTAHITQAGWENVASQQGRPPACSTQSRTLLCSPFPPLTMLGCIWRCHPGLAAGIPGGAGHGRIPSQPGVSEVSGQVHAEVALAAGACNGLLGLRVD